MEPVTHVLTGACLARAGFNRRAAYATFAMAAAAELPDIDSLWAFRGPVEAFQHHRGITHTFLGVLFEAAFVVLVLYGVHRWRAARYAKRARPVPVGDHVPVERPLTAAPVRWGLLYGFCLVALLSHLLLDYTNNYGLRPFYPFNPHWYAASIVFIFDPLIFALLLMGLIVPAIFRLVSAEVGARRQPFTGTGWPRAALFLIVMLWGVRWIEHDRAMQLAMAQSLEAPPPPESVQQQSGAASTPSEQNPQALPTYLSARRALANPDPLSLFRWYTVTDFGPVYQLERVDTREQTIEATEGTYGKPEPSPALVAAEASPLGRAYLDWSPTPILSVDNSRSAVEQAMADADEPPMAGGTVVTFRDPRFMGVLPWRSNGGASSLGAVVVLDQQNRVVLESMSGHVEPER
jgi:inner membrane protein